MNTDSEEKLASLIQDMDKSSIDAMIQLLSAMSESDDKQIAPKSGTDLVPPVDSHVDSLESEDDEGIVRICVSISKADEKALKRNRKETGESVSGFLRRMVRTNLRH